MSYKWYKCISTLEYRNWTIRLGATKELQAVISVRFHNRVKVSGETIGCANLRTKIDGPVLNFETVVTRTCLENDRGFAFLPSVNLGRWRLVTCVERDAMQSLDFRVDLDLSNCAKWDIINRNFVYKSGVCSLKYILYLYSKCLTTPNTHKQFLKDLSISINYY